MNPWQLAQQLKATLAAVRWPDASAAVVFGPRSVLVFAGAPSDEEAPPGFPFALVTIDAGTPDADDPDLILQQFTIVTAVEVAGDALGEFAVIGSATADLGKSAGRGVAEVSERVRAAVQDLTGIDGAAMVVSGTGVTAPASLGRGKHLAFDETTVTALCTSQPFYAPPQQVKVNGSVVSWRGVHCEARFDFLRYRIGYVVGSTPAETPAECAGFIYTGTHREAAVSIVPGRAYSVFADYDARGTGTPSGSSSGRAVGAFLVP